MLLSVFTIKLTSSIGSSALEQQKVIQLNQLIFYSISSVIVNFRRIQSMPLGISAIIDYKTKLLGSRINSFKTKKARKEIRANGELKTKKNEIKYLSPVESNIEDKF
jgi:hypothetical protein